MTALFATIESMHKRIAFIGQAPASPNSKHSTAGTYISAWLHKLEIDDKTIAEHCRFYALMGSFPGSTAKGHIKPTQQQIAKHRPVLANLLADFQPEIVVPVGAMAIAEVLPEARGALVDIIGETYAADPFNSLGRVVTVIPWPHPSGRSTWVQ